MTTRQIAFAAGMGALLLAFAYVQTREPETINWSPDFRRVSTEPHGQFLLHAWLGVLFPEEPVAEIDATPYEVLLEGAPADPVYLFVNDAIEMGEPSVDALLDLAAGGAQVFIATAEWPAYLADSLGIEFGLPAVQFPRPTLQPDTVQFTLLTRGADGSYPMLRAHAGSTFRAFDSTSTQVLGRYEGTPNFLRVSVGDGAIYAHVAPYAFSNYALAEGFEPYAFAALSHLQARPVLWDEYYKTGRVVSASPMRYVLSQPALRWAYGLAVLGVVLFLSVRSRRRQRAIPVVEPPKNASRDFVETVGRLTFNQGDHAELAERQRRQFFAQVRRTLNLDVPGDPFDAAFLRRLAARAGQPVDETKTLISDLSSPPNSAEQALRRAKRIHAFWQG